jgi:hypothetical protein
LRRLGTQFTCFTSTEGQKLAHKDAASKGQRTHGSGGGPKEHDPQALFYYLFIYFLFFFCIQHHESRLRPAARGNSWLLGLVWGLTCFSSGSKGQAPNAAPPKKDDPQLEATGTQFTCFTSTKVQILTPAATAGYAFFARMPKRPSLNVWLRSSLRPHTLVAWGRIH